MSETITLDGATSELVSEGQVNLTDFADEPGGAWPKGWYKAAVIEGYSTRKGTQFTTEDTVSKNGESRNVRICFAVTNAKGETRNLQESFNYRPSDFTPDRLAYIKEIRQEYKNVKGAWPDKDGQRSSLAIAKLGQFQRALGIANLPLTPNGTINPATFIGAKLDVQLGIDDNSYNDVRQYAKDGERTGGQKPTAAA